MFGNGLRWMVLPSALAFLFLFSGCQTETLMRERDDLRAQNLELQEQLNSARSAHEASEADRSKLAEENERLRSQPPVQTFAPPPASPVNAFSGIEGVETVSSPGRITVRVPGDILFSPGKADLKPSAQKTLEKIASIIHRDYPSNLIRVEGYTDSDPIRKSKWQDNLELSLQRAAAVHRYLQKHGVTPKQMEAVGLGQWHPRSSKALSRRVEITVKLDS